MTYTGERTVFIADSHLVSHNDENYKALLSFLDGLTAESAVATDPLTLVILGDFFDFWVGYKNLVPGKYVPILSRLFDLSQNGVNIHYTEGNHDFFMGPFFTDYMGATVHPEPWEMATQGLKIYIAHGDRVNNKDYGYRFLRYLLRSLPVRLIRRLLPNFVLEMIANAMSTVSRVYTDTKRDEQIKIVKEFSHARFGEGFDAVVLGHFHEQMLQTTNLDGKEHFYVNAGCWMDGIYDYVVLEGGRFKPMQFD